MTKLNSIYKKIYYWYIIFEILLFSAMFFPINKMMMCITICIDFILGFVVLYYTNMLHKSIAEKISIYGVWAGIIFIFGGGALDIAVTAIYSPDLSEEGNPVLVALLNNHFSLNSIYFFTLCYQLLKTTIFVSLWMIFLKTYPKMLQSIPYINFYTTLKWLLGAQKMRFLDLLLGRKINFDYFVPTLSFIVVACNFIHWYAAMEWLGIIPVLCSTMTLASAIMFISLFTLTFFTHIKIKSEHQKTIILF